MSKAYFCKNCGAYNVWGVCKCVSCDGVCFGCKMCHCDCARKILKKQINQRDERNT